LRKQLHQNITEGNLFCSASIPTSFRVIFNNTEQEKYILHVTSCTIQCEITIILTNLYVIKCGLSVKN
jgi:hypothetical protein